MKQERKRVIVLSLLMFALFSLLVAQFFRIQIIEGAKWAFEGRKQHYFVVKEPFMRGSFFSNTAIKKGHPEKPQPFVIDIQKFHLYIDPDSIPEEFRAEISTFLLSKVEVEEEDRAKFRSEFDRKSRSRRLAMWLDRETRDAILSWWKPYAQKHKIARNALFFVSDYQRSYPFGKLLGQVLHTIQNHKDASDQVLPTGGLELYFNKYLKGKQGKRLLMRSPRNSFEVGKVIESPEDGANVYLTINHVLQAIAEEEIAKGVKKAKAKAGWAVMMDPHTGEILALAQYPFFYPPDYMNYFNDPELIDHTRVKAVTDAIQPGSAMKGITITIALMANEELVKRGEKPIFDPEAKIQTTNTHFKGRKKPLADTRPHSFLNMKMALQKSSNVYLARLVEQIIERLGVEWYRDKLHKVFGFGERTHIELPSESKGVLPLPGKKHPNGRFEWSVSTPYSLAIGHNIQTTSMQLLRAFALFANGGYIVKPTLIRKIEKNSEVLVDNTTASKGERVLDPSIINQVIPCMKFVTKPGGTAPRANVPGFTECGKSGTPEKVINGQYVNQFTPVFVGFTPVTNPAFVLVVTLDEPEVGYIPGVGKNHHGGTACGPIFREIAKRSLEYLGVTPDDPYGYPVGDPRYNAEKADWVKETRLLKEMYEKWNIHKS